MSWTFSFMKVQSKQELRLSHCSIYTTVTGSNLLRMNPMIFVLPVSEMYLKQELAMHFELWQWNWQFQIVRENFETVNVIKYHQFNVWASSLSEFWKQKLPFRVSARDIVMLVTYSWWQFKNVGYRIKILVTSFGCWCPD